MKQWPHKVSIIKAEADIKFILDNWEILTARDVGVRLESLIASLQVAREENRRRKVIWN